LTMPIITVLKMINALIRIFFTGYDYIE
jgi:hypothetical protein